MRKITVTMKSITLLIAFLWLGLSGYSQLIISQYYEGSSNNKYIEITNVGETSIDLSTYYLGRWSNTDAPSGTAANFSQLSGTIAAGETQVYMNASAVEPAYAVALATDVTTATYFNGNDPVAITNGSNDWADRVDCIYAAGTWGAEKSFVRNADVTIGNTEMSVVDGSGEWTEYTTTAVNEAVATATEYLGTHVYTGGGGDPDPEPTNHVTSFTAAADGATSITLTWDDNDGTQPAAAYIIKANTDAGSITAPVDGTSEANDTDLTDGAGVANVGHGVQTYTFSNCSGATTYNFAIYPYTNSGADIDFKTDGTVPTASATTDELGGLPFNETFDGSLGQMSTYSVVGDQEWYQDEYGGATYAKMSGYSGGAQDNEDWMITPGFDFTGLTTIQLSFDEAINYSGGNVDIEQEIYVSTDYTTGNDPSTATWTKMTVTGRATGSSWDFVSVNPVDLSSYAGETSVFVGFKYTSTTDGAATWEVDNVFVGEGSTAQAPAIANIVVTPENPTSSDAVSVSADVTDADGTVESVVLNYGTVSGTLDNSINMTGSGDTYTTETAIPAMEDGTTVYYQIVAIDNDAASTTTSEMSYDVSDGSTAAIPYTETFDADLGDMYVYSEVGDQGWYQDEYSGTTYAKMSGFSGSAQENIDWMITPGFDFSGYGDIQLQFTEAINYSGGDVENEQEVYVSTDYAGVGDPTTATWTKLTVTGRATGSAWDFVTVDAVDLSAYAAETSVYIAFKYTSTTDAAATWEIDEVVIAEVPEFDAPVVTNVAIDPIAPTSSDAVSVSADVTDVDGTVATVVLNWGTVSGSLSQTINMVVSAGDTYVTESDIPAQADGVNVYYQITATDNDAQVTVTSEMNYQVTDPSTAELPYEQGFDNDLGDMIAFSVVGDQVWGTDSYGNPAPCAKISGYAGGNNANEDWLITPGLDFSGVTNAKLSFEEAINYGGNVEEEQQIFVSTNYAGVGDPSSATWTELNVTGRSTGDSWSFVLVDDTDLSAYAGESLVYIAFKYTSTDANGATWELDNIKVEEGAAIAYPEISNVTNTPEVPTSSDAVSVSADVTDADGTISSVTLSWGTDTFYTGGTITMSVSSGDTYTTDEDIPAQENGTVIFYKIVAVDNDSNESVEDLLTVMFVDPFTGVLPYFEPFISDLGTMSTYSETGDQEWHFDEYGGEGYAYMSGYSGGSVPNVDWLVSPSIDFSGVVTATMNFEEAINFDSLNIDNHHEVLISTDYDGSGDPTSATWTNLEVNGRANGTSWSWYTVYDINLDEYAGETSVYVAFRYTSTDEVNTAWELDNVSISGSNGIMFTTAQQVNVYPNPANNFIQIQGVNNIERVQVMSIDGKLVKETTDGNAVISTSGLNNGIYMIRVFAENEMYISRFVKE